TFAPESSLPPGPRTVVLEAGAAFGSGLHPTTRLCLDRLVADPPAAPVLDVGTGSGVLALAALRLGAPWALGTEVDAAARAVAARNAARNALSDRLRIVDAAPDATG